MIGRISRYEVEAEIGRGGFGQVFRAYDPTVGRVVALKTLTGAGDPDLLVRFQNEAAAAGKLKHQNIVTIYDFGNHEGSPYLVMELLDGEDLEQVIASRRVLPLFDKVDIMAQVAAGLHHAHSQHVVHRDVKPANIMLLRSGGVKIMDFGIALLTEATAARLTPQGSLIGTYAYMAPEQFLGTPSDSLTDIFAYGVTCYKLVTGVHPFAASEIGGLMHNIIHKSPAAIRTLSPECPELLEEAVMRALSKDRASRYQSLEDLHFDVEPIIGELKRERIGDLLNQARGLIEAGDLDRAQVVVKEVRVVDPGNTTARELLGKLQSLTKEKEIRSSVAALLSKGREQLRARNFDEAIQRFESALKADKSNPEIHALIGQAREGWQQVQRAEQLFEVARRAANLGDLTGAHKNAAEAVSADPENTKVRALLAIIAEQVAARERERRLRDGLSRTKGLILLQNFEPAIAALNLLKDEFPESPEIGPLLERATKEHGAQLRKYRLQEITDEAKDLLRNGHYGEAVARLAGWREEFPESVELRELASYAGHQLREEKMAQIVGRAADEVRKLLDKGNFDTAIVVLQKVLAEYPTAGSLREQLQVVFSSKAEHERKTALDRAVREATSYIASSRFAEALEQIGAFVRGYGSSASLDLLQRQAEQGLERQRKQVAVRKLLLDAQTLIDDGRPGTARDVLKDATRHYPEEPRLLSLLGVAQDQVREQRRNEAISKIIAEAESLSRAKQFEPALGLLDSGLQEYAGAERLVRCREATVASRTAYEAERLRRETLGQAQKLRLNGKRIEALNLLRAALEKLGQDTTLNDLKQQLEAEQVESQRAEEVGRVVAHAQELIDLCNLAGAREILRAASARYPSEEAIRLLIATVECRAKELKRIEEIAKFIAEVREHANASRHENALQVVDEGIRRYGRDSALIEVREEVVRAKSQVEQDRHMAEQARHREEEEIRKVIGETQVLLLREDLESAKELLERAAARYPDGSEIRKLLGQVQDSLSARERARSLGEISGHAQKLADAGQWPIALQVLDAGLTRYPDADALIRARQAVLSAQSRAEALTAARALRASGYFERALSIVRAALERFPQDRELQELKAELEVQLRAELTERSIKEGLDAANELIRRNEPVSAVSLLDSLLQRFGNDERVQRAKNLASDLLDKQQQEALRRKTIARTLSDVSKLERSGQTISALHAIETTLGKYPEDEQLLSVANQLKNLISDEDRRAKIAAQVQNIERALSGNDWTRAYELLGAAQRAFPNESIWHALKTSLTTQQRKSDLGVLDKQVRKSLERRDFTSAARVLAKHSELSEDPLWQVLSQELERWKAYEAVLEQSEQAFRSGDYDQAEERLAAMLQQGAPDDRARTLLATVLGERQRKVRESRIAQGLDKSKGLALLGDLSGARLVIDMLLREFPDSDELKRGLKTLRQTQQAETRSRQGREPHEATQRPFHFRAIVVAGGCALVIIAGIIGLRSITSKHEVSAKPIDQGQEADRTNYRDEIRPRDVDRNPPQNRSPESPKADKKGELQDAQKQPKINEATRRAAVVVGAPQADQRTPGQGPERPAIISPPHSEPVKVPPDLILESPPASQPWTPRAWNGKRRGRLSWNGVLAPGDKIVLEPSGKTLGPGACEGDYLPGDVRVEALTSTPGMVIETKPDEANHYNRLVLVNHGSAPVTSIDVSWKVK